ncbi:condensation domain protein [Mycobacterium xenopi 4042]|uniref:Condensation domain protein n=1 Tax=Mycobacterium xenopi 4042 TaxID=1299334 RepID=X8APA8_MYCXE|nr:condensation domain protein [Mycobacterium xenopi 4042]
MIRVAEDQHRFVITNHHIVLDGWSVPVLLREIFATYYGRRLTAPPPYRSFITWLAGRNLDDARAVWREVFDGFDTPTLVGPPDRLGLGRRNVESFLVPEQTTCAVTELARSRHITVNTVLQAAWAQLLMWLTGRHDVVFGAVVSGRPAEVAGAESMVGLLINTVPVRARITLTTTTAGLLDQLQRAHNDTLEHQHLPLSDIHRITGHDRLFDTVLVYENYPIDTADISSVDGVGITQLTVRDYYHYPLAVQAVPGRELDLRVQYRTDVFDAASIEILMGRFKAILAAMTADPTRPLSSMDLHDASQRLPRMNRVTVQRWTVAMGIVSRQISWRRSSPTSSPRFSRWTESGSMSRSSTWAAIRFLRCAQSPRSAKRWMLSSLCATSSTHQPFAVLACEWADIRSW